MFCKQVCLLCITETEGKKGNIVQYFFSWNSYQNVSLHELWYAKEKGKFLDSAMTCQLIICPFLRALWTPEQPTCDLPQYSGEYSTQSWQNGAIILTCKSWWQWTGQIILFYTLCVLKRRENVTSPTLALSPRDIYLSLCGHGILNCLFYSGNLSLCYGWKAMDLNLKMRKSSY